MRKTLRSFAAALLAGMLAAPALAGPAPVQAPASKAKTYQLVVMTNPVPGQEAEFDRWYTEVHLPEVLTVPGFVRAQRFRLVPVPGNQAKWTCLAIYELETEEAVASVQELMRRFNAGEMTGTTSMDPDWLFNLFTASTPLIARGAGPLHGDKTQ